MTIDSSGQIPQGFGPNSLDLGGILNDFNAANLTAAQASVEAKNIIRDTASRAEGLAQGQSGGVFNAENPGRAQLISPLSISSSEVDGIKNRISEIVNTPPSELSSPNAWLSPNIMVILRMVIFEAVAMMAQAKVVEKKLDIAAMNAMFDLAKVKAGLIMDAAKTEAVMHIVEAVVNFTQSFMSLSALGKMRSAKNADFKSAKEFGDAQNDLLKFNQNKSDAIKIKTQYRDKGIDIDNPPLNQQEALRRNELGQMDPHGSTASSKPIRSDAEEAEFKDLNERAIKNKEKVATDQEQLEYAQAKRDVEAKENENKKMLQDKGMDENQFRDHVHQQKIKHDLDQENLRYKQDFIRTYVEAWRGFSTGFNYASKAYLTVHKAEFEARQQIVDASQKIAEKMMNGASQSYNDLAQLITKMIDDLTRAVSANFQAFSSGSR